MKYTAEQQAQHRELLARRLESGQYEQGRGALKRVSGDGFKYCCLGVATEIYHEITGNGRWLDPIVQRDGYSCDFQVADYDGVPHTTTASLTEVVGDFFGLRGLGYVNLPGEAVLAFRNDNGASFEEIAGYVREGTPLLR